jgi:hypothetical protein
MSPWKTDRPRADHYDTAARAKAAPGDWVLATTYAGRNTADSIARFVRTGGGRIAHAYRPAGRFETKQETVDDGTELWVRYLPTTVDALRAGLRWLYGTEQPDGAIVHHRGPAIPATGNRWYGVCPVGATGRPVISVDVARVEWVDRGVERVPVNPLEPGELDHLKSVLADLGATVHSTWNGHPSTNGSLELAEPAHPTLLAAVERYGQGCLEHPHRSVFCACDAWNNGRDLAVKPDLAGGA